MNLGIVLRIVILISLTKVKNNIMSREIVFILGDKLPTIYDAAVAIYSEATQPKTSKM